MKLARIAILSAALAASVPAWASMLFVSYDNFTYSGTVTRYATLSDAQSASNALSTTSISTATNGNAATRTDARDGQLYMASGAVGYDPTNLSYFSTAWYFTTLPANGNGWGNPNNTNTGFIQYYDATVAPTVTGGWSNGNMTFTVNVSGGTGDTGNFARLWAAPSVGGPAGDTGGVFHSFNLSMEANFLAAAVYNSSTTWHETGSDPDSMTGTATGIFENQSSTNASLNGFYAFDFSFAPGSWASDVGATWSDGTTNYSPSAFFAAPGANDVPEPGMLALSALALLGLAHARRRPLR